MEKRFHHIVRAIILVQGKLLVARVKGEGYVFLPGGHIELGEKTIDALSREIMEELGNQISIHGYLGTVEHKWIGKGTEHLEINHCFECSLSPEDGQLIESKEAHLDFFLIGMDEVEKFDLRPNPFKKLIGKYQKGDRGPWWDSTF